MFEPLKYLIQPVALERDEHGKIVGERVAQTQQVFSAAELASVIEDFEAEIEKLNREGHSERQDPEAANGQPQGAPDVQAARQNRHGDARVQAGPPAFGV